MKVELLKIIRLNNNYESLFYNILDERKIKKTVRFSENIVV